MTAKTREMEVWEQCVSITNNTYTLCGLQHISCSITGEYCITGDDEMEPKAEGDYTIQVMTDPPPPSSASS